MNSYFFLQFLLMICRLFLKILFIYIWKQSGMNIMNNFESFFLLVKIYNCSIKCNICVIFKIHFNA